MAQTLPSDLKEIVTDKYSEVARSTLSSNDQGVRRVAQAFGYSEGDLASIPAEANMGLSCGNPTATAGLRPGEVVLDLGCGGGIDVFLAAKKVGPTGKAIGIDLSPDMLARARAGATAAGITNVEFHRAEIEHLPLPDASVDCVISNCVINLVPDKFSALREIARVLKPGGRLAVSDIATRKPLPEEVLRSVAAYTGCIAGAISIDDYRRGLLEAGFSDVQIIDSGSDLNAYSHVEGQSGCCSPAMTSAPSEPSSPSACRASLPIASSSACCGGSGGAKDTSGPSRPREQFHAELGRTLQTFDVNEYAASVKVFAVKPAH